MSQHRPPIWTLPIDEVYSALDTQANGLSSEEAKQRLIKYGANELPTTPGRPLWLRFVDQLTHFMALLLWVGGILSFVAGMPQLGWAIWAVILINALFSFRQEFHAEQALNALKKVLPLQVKVLRDGNLVQLPASELVCGDVIQVEEGDRIPADARLIDSEECRVNLSVLTGEALPVARNAHPVRIKETQSLRSGNPLPRIGEHPQQERTNPVEVPNLILAGATIAAGRATAVIYATGAQTEFGQVAHLTTLTEREPSTLELQVARIVRLITTIAIGMGITTFLLSYLLIGMKPIESFIFAIGIIVANVPEGLLPTVTLALALGVQRMAKHNALVRRLSAVETLSAVSVICTDKTGTLTQNEMTVRYLWLPTSNTNQTSEEATTSSGTLLPVSGSGYDPTTGVVTLPQEELAIEQVKLLLTGAALCSNAKLIHPAANQRWQEIGDPTEAALLAAAAKAGLNLETQQQSYPRRREIPFDSRRRMMTVILDWRNMPLLGKELPLRAITKGAPLEVLRHCHQIWRDGQIHELTSNEIEQITEANDALARQGFRVLGVASKDGDERLLTQQTQDLEQDLIFIGLIAMFDPPRPEVPAAISQCHTAGIKVTMVTGDYGLTAEAIAKQIGLFNGNAGEIGRAQVVTGEEMEHLSDAQLKQMLKYRSTLLFARMSPEHKLRLVQSYKEIGEVVAVMGDGVNDAPALRAAHIGIAMGQSGTDVAREAADIVLTDDNFATIIFAIEQGRAIYQNIRKFMTYILASNTPEIVPFLAMVALRIPPALTVLQILAVDLGTDMLPALALGAEKPEQGTMQQPPRAKKEFLLDKRLLLRAYAFLGMIEAILSMLAFLLVWWSHGYDLATLQAVTPQILNHSASPEITAIYIQATSVAFAAIVCCQVGNLFACRSAQTSAFQLNWLNNRLLWIGIGVELALLLAFIHIPFLQGVFNTSALTLTQWLLLVAFAPTLLMIEELRKWLSKK